MENYIIEKVIGEGTFGIVYRAKEKSTNDTVAIKKFKSVQDEQLSKREIQAISMLNHPYIVSYRYSFRHEGLLHLVFDYVCDSMTKLLERHRKGIPPDQAQRLIYQLCQSLQCCHNNMVIHRDVKPENILIDDRGDIKLCDFGVARTIAFQGDPLSEYVATRWYRPPEQELRLPYYSFDADIWSVGCVLVELLTGRPLFPGHSQIDQVNLIQEVLGPLPPSLAARAPRGLQQIKKQSTTLESILSSKKDNLPIGTIDFLHNTLKMDRTERFTVKDCLNHAFLKPLHDEEMAEKKERRLRHIKKRKDDEEIDEEDGIEEEIPGHKSTRSSHTSSDRKKSADSVEKFGPRGADLKASFITGSPKTHHRPFHHKAQTKPCNNNTKGAGESDDIEEIIDTEDGYPSPVKCGHGCEAKKTTSSNDPTADHEYEDDFEDYHS